MPSKVCGARGGAIGAGECAAAASALRCGHGRWRRSRGHIGLPGEIAQPSQTEGVSVKVHVRPQRDDGIDCPFLFERSHPLAVDQSAVHDENFDHAFVHGPNHLFHQFIKDGAFMPPAGHHAGRHHKEEIQFTVDVDQAH